MQRVGNIELARLRERDRVRHETYEDNGELHLTESQEQSGVISAWCFLGLVLMSAAAGIVALVQWAFS